MFMNIFRITGDVCHLLSFVVMFWKLHTSKSVAGISLKTQELYVMVFVARYLDLFWNWLSYYNVVMKIIFIASSVAIVYVIRFGVPHKDTYNAEDDAFPYMYLIVPAALLGVAINQDYSSPFEMCWAFSIYLEAVAILPQLFMLQKQGGAAGARTRPVPAATTPPRPAARWLQALSQLLLSAERRPSTAEALCGLGRAPAATPGASRRTPPHPCLPRQAARRT